MPQWYRRLWVAMMLDGPYVAYAGYADTFDTWAICFRGKTLVANNAHSKVYPPIAFISPSGPSIFCNLLSCIVSTILAAPMPIRLFSPLYLVASGAGPGTRQPVLLSLRALASGKNPYWMDT